MEQDFITSANEALKPKQIELRPFQDCRDLWAETFTKLPFQSARYMADIVDYYTRYFEEKSATTLDQSAVIIANNAPIGLWPLMMVQENEASAFQFMTHGDAVLPPLFTPQYPHRASNRLHHKLFDLMQDYTTAHSLNTPLFADAFMGQIGVSEWYAQTIQIAPKSTANHIQYAQTERGMAFIESHIRKAYKPLINGAKKTFTTTIVTAENADDFLIYKDLHHHVSGRVTRNAATWAAQHTLVTKGQGFCVLIRKDDDVVGAAYFSMSGDEASYFSGAYKKEYVTEPLGHLALYTAIEHAINHHVKWFRIGLLRQDSAQKLNDIDFFKNGFASHIIIENQTST